MTTYAGRRHQTTVSLAPGETKLFRLPPTTRGIVNINAKVVVPIGGGPIPVRRDGTTRDHRGEAPPGEVRDTREVRAGSRDPRDRRGVGGGTVVARGRGFIRDHRLGGLGGLGDLEVDPGDVHPGSATPTDLKMELLLGGSISKATHGHHIMLDSQYVGEVWVLRLTRENRGGTGEQRYLIEATYPSVLPVMSREIDITAFQRAFDANWNQHPYVTIEMKSEHLYVTFDEDFRLLYGLENYVKDLSSHLYSIPDFTTTIRFSMAIDQYPITVNGTYDAPVMIVDARTSIGASIKLEFFLDAYGLQASDGPGAGFVARASVRGISDTIPAVDVRAEIEKAIQEYLDKLPRTEFSTKFTPWLIGEPHRELLAISAVSRRRFRVDWVGPRPPPSTEPVVIDDTVRPTGPSPEPPPYLFETPDETPPQGPPEPWEPVRPHITSAGPLEVIRNIVVLMLENRSFDQVLGYLSREEGRADVNGLSSDDLQHWEEFPDNIPRRPHRAETTAWPGFDKPGPIHHTDGVRKQMGPNLEMNKFVANFDERAHGDDRLLDLIKAYFGPAQLPAYRALTEEFAICDQWFTPHAGPTWPNRYITFTGDLNLDHRGNVEEDNPNLSELTPSQAKTIFDHLNDRGLAWRVYEHGYSMLRLYGRYTFETQRIVDFRDPNRGFIADARAGRLPPFTFIEPDYVDLPPGNDDHPPADMADGQQLVATIVSAMLESPQWQNSMLVITYDEHGGFYDHVRPVDGPPLAGGNVRRGPRVPAFVVSPWVARGAVSKTLYDHTSILATVVRAFMSPHAPRLSPRADGANDLRDLIQPTARPRSDYDAVYARLVAIRDQVRNPSRPPPEKLNANPEADDFHAVMRYVRSFT